MQQIRGGGASEVLSVSIPSTSTTGGALKSPQLLAQNFHSLSFLSPPSHLTKVKNHNSLHLLPVLHILGYAFHVVIMGNNCLSLCVCLLFFDHSCT